MERPPARVGFPKPSTPPQMKRRLIDKLRDAIVITAWTVLVIVIAMAFVRSLPFEVGVNIAAAGLFFLTCAITFVKASRFAENAIVIGGSVVSFVGIFAFCPPSLLWEWSILVAMLILIVAVELIRAARKALQQVEAVGDAVLGAVTRIAQKETDIALARPIQGPVAVRYRTKIPHGRNEWLITLMLGVTTFVAANVIRAFALALLTPVNVLFTATALIGLGVLGMMMVAFSGSDNAAEDALAGTSVAVGWMGIYLAWPHPVWHILVLLVMMSLLAGGTVGPILARWIQERTAT